MKTCENEKLLNPAANIMQYHCLKLNFLHSALKIKFNLASANANVRKL